MAYKEIVTKAVIGKGKKRYVDKYEVSAPQIPSTILGCWIINHNFQATETNDHIVINGSYDANIWYSYENDTKTTVITKNITYTEEEKLTTDQKEVINKDVIIRSLKQPTCISAKENGSIIELEIEKELGIEIIGDTKVKISSVDEDEVWDNIDNEEDDVIAEDDIDNIDTNYISKEIIK